MPPPAAAPPPPTPAPPGNSMPATMPPGITRATVYAAHRILARRGPDEAVRYLESRVAQ
jgi:hypothetical protein